VAALTQALPVLRIPKQRIDFLVWDDVIQILHQHRSNPMQPEWIRTKWMRPLIACTNRSPPRRVIPLLTLLLLPCLCPPSLRAMLRPTPLAVTLHHQCWTTWPRTRTLRHYTFPCSSAHTVSTDGSMKSCSGVFQSGPYVLNGIVFTAIASCNPEQ
jgi:hypothetical protein